MVRSLFAKANETARIQKYLTINGEKMLNPNLEEELLKKIKRYFPYSKGLGEVEVFLHCGILINNFITVFE